jgi:hypothetical protein
MKKEMKCCKNENIAVNGTANIFPSLLVDEMALLMGAIHFSVLKRLIINDG